MTECTERSEGREGMPEEVQAGWTWSTPGPVSHLPAQK
jgi:hypothetical protein